MRVTPRAVLFCLCLTLTSWAIPARGAAPPADRAPADPVEEVRVCVAQADYRGALAKISKLLYPSNGDLAAAEQYELLMLKGECQLQLHDRLGASSAFKSAGKVATNVQQLAMAHANSLIVEKSPAGRFTPRTGASKEPIDILPIDSRKQAMVALQADLASQYAGQLKTALQADQLPVIEKVFPRVADAYFLEMAATGQAGESAQTMRDLGQHAFKLMQSEISRCARRADQLGQVANSSSGGWYGGRMGLTSTQRDELTANAKYLVNIRDRASEYRRIASRLGGNEEKWDSLVALANDTLMDTESLCNDQ